MSDGARVSKGNDKSLPGAIHDLSFQRKTFACILYLHPVKNETSIY